MHTNIRRIVTQPVVHPIVHPSLIHVLHGGHVTPGSHGTLNEETQTPGSMSRTGSGVKLSKNPKDLYTLWKEWELGLNGVKPAKDFTYHKRGANKFSYCQHKDFWDAVTGLISKGFTSDTAIDRIYLVYCQGKSIDQILKLMAQDR